MLLAGHKKKKQQPKKGPKRIKQPKRFSAPFRVTQSKMPFTLKSLLMDSLSRISDLSDLSPSAAF